MTANNVVVEQGRAALRDLEAAQREAEMRQALIRAGVRDPGPSPRALRQQIRALSDKADRALHALDERDRARAARRR